jgi:hypothetical protein
MSPMNLREHKTTFAIMALFLALAFGLTGFMILAAGDESMELAASGAERSEFCAVGEPAPFDVAKIEGQSVTDAENWLTDNGYSMRPVVVDGKPQAMTMDMRPDRANVQVDGGRVSYYCFMG